MLLNALTPRKSAISLTPLIDVVFILLLFFMLSSTFNQTKQIDFNAASNVGSQSIDSESHRIILLADNHALVNGTAFDMAAPSFAEILKSLAESDGDVTLSARPEVNVQNVISLLDQLKSTGIENLSLSETVSQ